MSGEAGLSVLWSSAKSKLNLNNMNVLAASKSEIDESFTTGNKVEKSIQVVKEKALDICANPTRAAREKARTLNKVAPGWPFYI